MRSHSVNNFLNVLLGDGRGSRGLFDGETVDNSFLLPSCIDFAHIFTVLSVLLTVIG